MAQQTRRDPSQPTPKRKAKRPHRRATTQDKGPQRTPLLDSSLLLLARHALGHHDSQGEEELTRTEREKALVLDNMSELVAFQDTSMRVLWANKAVGEALGLAPEQLVGRYCYEVWHQRSKPCPGCPAERAGETDEPQEGEITSPDGRVWFVRRYPVPDASGDVVGAVEVALDITQRKRAEETLRDSEQRFRSLFEATLEGILVHENGVILDANPAFEKMTGHPLSELVGRPIVDLVASESRDLIVDRIRSGAGEPDGWEAVGLRKDGTTLDVEISGKSCTYQGRPARVTAVRDITERKRAEEALLQSEERYRSLVEASADGIVLSDLNTNIIMVNRQAVKLCGFDSAEEMIGRNASEFVAPEDRARAAENTLRTLETGGVTSIEYTFLKKDGSRFPGELSASLIRDAEGRPQAFTAMVRDITKRKKAEEALQESEERFRQVAETAHEWISELDAEGRYTYSSPAVRHILGYEPEEVLGKHFYDFFPPEDESRLLAEARRMGAHREPYYRLITPNVHRDGHTILVECSGLPILDPEGKVVGYRNVAQDVTERRRAEEAIRESEEKFRNIFSSARDCIVYLDTSGTILDVNEKAVEVFGGPREEVLGKHFTTVGVFDPVDLPKLADSFAAIVAGEQTELEVCIKNREGLQMFLDCSSSLLNGADGDPGTVVVVARDITERKRAEDALRESEASARWLSNATSDIIMSLKVDGTVLSINDAVQRMLGYRPEDVVGKNLAEFVHPEDVAAVRAAADERLQGSPDSSAMECRVRHRDGSWRMVESIGTISTDKTGEIIPVISTRDITNRKRAEDALRESEARYRLLVENISDVIWTMDLNLRYTYVSSLKPMRGYTVEEAMSQTMEEALTPASVEVARKALAEELAIERMEQKDLYRSRTLELEFNCKDGSTVWTEVKMTGLRDQDDRLVGILGVSRNITERKRMEEALQKTREELEAKVERQMRRGNNYGLTFREITVLHLVTAGESDREIGITLGISHLTAQKHVANILAKMGAGSRTEAGVRALREGLLD